MIAAVVVTFSAPAEVLDRCLGSLVAAGGLDRIIVVDTGGAATIAADRVDAVELVRMENRGYGAAANFGFGLARSAGADRIVLLNDDVVARPGWLDPLVAALDGDVGRVGAVQPMLVTADHDVITSLGVEVDRHGAGSDIGDGAPAPADRRAHDVEIFNAGTVVFDAEFLAATGGFDERYFLYYEDVDLSRRGRRLGWTYRVVPASVVEHSRGTSTSAVADRTLYLQERNRLWVAFRFADPATIGRALWLSIRRLRHAPRGVHARALAAGLAGAPRRIVERCDHRRSR